VPGPDEAKEYLPGVLLAERDQLGDRVTGRLCGDPEQVGEHATANRDQVLVGIVGQPAVEHRIEVWLATEIRPSV
jgi:hypothetical protein